MNAWTDIMLVVLILTTFWLLGSSRLASCILSIMLQRFGFGAFEM